MRVLLLVFFICTFITLLCIKLCPAPYFWAGLAWTVAFLFLFKKEKKHFKKAVWFNIAFITGLLTVAELYFWAPYKTHVQAEGNMWLQEQFVKDDILGYAPPRLATNVVGKKYYNNQLFYDTTYSTDEHGQRTTYRRSHQAAGAVLFFGCSLTFGDGLNDNQTLPFQLGQLEAGRYNTYNFGYSGYGPHQMLSAIEHGLVDKIVKEKPKYAIYTAIPGHILRSAGLQSWVVTAHDPRYELVKMNEIAYQGHFDDNFKSADILKRRVLAHLSNSHILKNIYLPFKFNQKRIQNEQDLNLYIQIVIKASILFEQRYPGAEFHIILWNLYDSINTEKECNYLLNEFKKHGIKVHMIGDILPSFYQNNPHYQLVLDSHPTAYANFLIAKYIAKDILHESTG